MILTGGGALIRGLDRYLSDVVKLPVAVGNEPLLAVARGTSEALDNLDLEYVYHCLHKIWVSHSLYI